LALLSALQVLLVLVFLGYLWWLNARACTGALGDHDPLTGLPVSIKMNPLRDRSTEKAANKFSPNCATAL